MFKPNEYKVYLFLPILIFLLFCDTAWSKPIGTLSLQSGKVIIHSQDKDTIYTGQNGVIELNQGDNVRSGKSTRAKIILGEKGDRIELYSNTFLSLDHLDRENTEISLPKGKARFIVTSASRTLKRVKRRFRVRSINAVVGVKGTDFIVQVIGESTSVLTLEGVVSLANEANPEIEIEIAQNQAAQTNLAEPLTSPVPVTLETQEAILSADEAENWDEIEFESGPSENVGTGSNQTAEENNEEAENTVNPMEEVLVDEVIEEVIEAINENISDNPNTIILKITDE